MFGGISVEADDRDGRVAIGEGVAGGFLHYGGFVGED